MDLALAIDRARPGAAYLLAGGAIQEWRDGRPQPTPAELNTAWGAIAAEQAAAATAEATRQQADTTDLGLYTPLLTQLAADRALLIDAGQTLNLAQMRGILARVIRMELLLARLLARRLGLEDAGVPNT